nr:hypothetical protein [Tanacetum cinerariifolium]
SSGLRRFFRYAMFIYSFYLCYVLSLYPFTEHYAQPYFFSCLIRQTFKTLWLLDYALMIRHDYDITTMDMMIDQQVALDEALVPHAHRLRFRRSNFRLLSDISSKESTLQLILPGQTFDEPPFEAEILAFIRFLGHSGEIRRLTDVNINKLHQPWRSFAVIINKCLTGKDFVYQVKYKETKKSNEMYYPRFTKVIIHFFMSKDLSIPRRNKVNWHYIRDDQMFTMIKLVSRHQNTQQFGAMLPIELTNADIRKSEAYKEYYVVAIGATPPKTKASLKLATERSLQQTHISQASSSGADEETGTISGVPDVPTEESDEEISWKSSDEGDDEDDEEGSSDDEQASDEEGEKFIHPIISSHDKEETKDEESYDPIVKTPKNTDDEVNDEENMDLNVGREEGQDDEDDEDELYRDVNINLEGRVVQMANAHTTQEFEDSHVTLTLTTSQMEVQAPTTMAPLPLSTPTLTPSTIATTSTVQQAPTPSTKTSSTILQDLPNFGSLFGFDHRLKTLEANFSEFVQMNQFAGAVSFILEIVQRYMDQWMNEAVNTVNEQLEAEVLTWSSNSSKTSYAVTADLSKMELKKILIEKMEGNKSIHRYNEQKNLYKALVEAYKSDKIILDTYGDTFMLKRHRDDDADKDEEPSAGSDRGSKRRREGKEPESASAPKEKATRSAKKSTQGSKSRQMSASESTIAEEPMQTTHEMDEPSHLEFETDRDWIKTLPATHGSIQPWISELAKQSDSRSSFNDPMDTPVDFLAFLMNQLKVDTLTPKLLAGPTYELMKASCKSLVKLELFLEEVYKETTDQLDWINPEGQQYLHNLLKPLPLIPNSRGRRVIPFDHFINNDLEYLRGGALSRKYTTSVTKTKAADYGHIKWIEDLVPQTMWIQEPLTNLTVEERFAINVSLRMFTRSIVIQRRVEDLQLGVESYQKKLNLTRPVTYRSDLKRKEAYSAYSNPRGFIYQNKDKQNRLMRVDELHKFSDGTLTDVRTTLDDRLKGIQMKYLPKSIWRKSDKERAAAMIQAINKQLKTRKIMRSLERFVGGRLYEGDFRMLQRTI